MLKFLVHRKRIQTPSKTQETNDNLAMEDFLLRGFDEPQRKFIVKHLYSTIQEELHNVM
jgi:hypothetical protein